MDLDSLLTRHPFVRLAKSTDNTRLLQFYENTRVSEGKLVLSYRRNPDFFKLLEAQGDSSLVFYGEADGGAIEGIGSISFRDGVIGGRPVRVGYLGDLRVAHNPIAIKAWRRFLKDFLETSPSLAETGHCSHYLTAVLDANGRADRGLVRNHHGLFSYDPVMHYNISMLVLRLPFMGRQPHWPQVLGAESGDLNQLIDFLDRENSIRPYGFVFRASEWERRLKTWENFGLKNFLLAKDPNGKLIGCVSCWNHPWTKRMVVERMSLPIKILSKAQRLMGGTPLTDSEGAINIAHTTHFEVAHQLPEPQQIAVKCALLDAAWKQAKNHMAVLSFCDDASASTYRSLRGRFLGHTTPASLYRVHSGSNVQKKLTPDGLSAGSPGFEMALV